ncbi:MAG: tetratricopeptide repeat protein [Anaeromyxobacteraceae bacterium]
MDPTKPTRPEALAYDPTVHGLPPEVGDAIAALAEAELAAGRLETARALLEGLVVTSPEDPGGWALLSRTHRRLGQPLAARFCAEVALKLDPASGEAGLARAESLLALPDAREEGARALEALRAHPTAGPRACALLGALSGAAGGLAG